MKDRGDDERGPEADEFAGGDNSAWRRQENHFSEFDDDEDFEESDRDSDFDAIYTEVEEPEPELEAVGDDVDAWSLEHEDESDKGEAEDDDSSPWDEPEEEDGERDLWDLDLNPEGSFDHEPPEEPTESIATQPAAMQPAAFAATQSDTQEWDELADDDENYEEEFEDEYEEENYSDDKERQLNVSLGMIVVAVFALILLGAGGYGIIEERASLQEEVRQLQANLATSAPPEEVAASRDAANRTSVRNTQLQREVEELSRENRSLQAIISGLESQLSAQKAALARAPAAQAVEPEPAAQTSPKPKPAAEPKASPLHDAATSTAGNSGWFVNFSSYSQRDTAESWSGRLKPGQGQVVVEAAQSNGKRIYRVRVVNLPDKETAQALAVQLQQKFNTGKLWVGRSS